MATSSFFYSGSNEPDQTQTQTPPTTIESSTDTVKTSFYYGSTPGPDQNTYNELIQELNSKVSEATAAQSSASTSAGSAASSAASASASASAAAGSAAEAAAIISHFTISTQNPSGGVDGDVWFKIT